ncbi:hypothetical protein [Pyrococcus yayanosii]|uniref:Permease n=1 Tax=Pyrococcus yayanosii (strain CH1 / JCM 16557) TaxID=529709 RepID=F8AFC8_PYRYC|nr:hypothetical protein [Pyrococcus yayanosii]AEH23735.1 hypothetical protein PYCH_00220 [Pyrococcus yayanosii CH1]
MLRLLYRELRYRIMKDNPMIAGDPEKLEKNLKHQGSILWSVGLQSIVYLGLGAMLGASIYFAKEGRAVIFASYLLLPFIISLYTSTLNVSYAVSMGIFEPLKPLPVKSSPLYLSALILLDVVPAFFLLLPAVLALANVPAALLGILWTLTAIFMGHSLGLFIYVHFGTIHVGRRSILKNIGKTIGILLIVGIYYVIRFMEDYIESHIEMLAGIFERYSFAFPMAASTVYEPLKSIGLLTLYMAFSLALYIYTLRRVWEAVSEPRVVGKTGEGFRLSVKEPVVAVALKDLKTVFRRSQLLASFLVPVYVVFYPLYQAISSGLRPSETLLVLLIVSLLTSMLSDAALKLEAEGFEFLRTLPLQRETFLMGKALTMAAIPTGMVAILVTLSVLLNGAKALPLLLYLPLPLATALISVAYVASKMGDDIAMPKMGFVDSIAMFLLTLIPVLLIGIAHLLIGHPEDYLAGFIIEMAVMLTASRILR